METKKDLGKISKRLKRAFAKVVIRQCTMCGAFLPESEYKQFEGVCKKHWDY